MQRQRWFPSRIADQIPWYNNFADKVVGIATTLSLDDVPAEAVKADALWMVYVLGSWLADVRAFAQSGTAAIEMLESGTGAGVLPVFTVPALPAGVTAKAPGALTRILNYVAQLKVTPGFTEAMAEDLGVLGAENTADHPTPKFSLKVGQGGTCQCVDISFTKYTHQGVYIESKRGGDWEFLAIDTEKPYTDERPLLNAAQPEVREYRLRYWDKGTPNGPWSEVQKATVAP
jgi:hypothetical protein